MHSFSDALNLIDYSRAGFNNLKLEYGYNTDIKRITPGLPVLIKNFLENIRASLNFSAHALYSKLGDQAPTSKTIYFPYAWLGATEHEFLQQVNMYLPGMKELRPDVYEILNSYQYYVSETNIWLPHFMELCNDNHHADLVIEGMEGVDQLVSDFGVPDAGLIIRGGGTIEMGENASIGSEFASIKGEQSISLQSPKLKNQHGMVSSGINKHVLIYFESNGEEVLYFLDEVLTRTVTIIHELASID